MIIWTFFEHSNHRYVFLTIAILFFYELETDITSPGMYILSAQSDANLNSANSCNPTQGDGEGSPPTFGGFQELRSVVFIFGSILSPLH